MQIKILAKKLCDFFFCDVSKVEFSSRLYAVIPCYRDNSIRVSITRTKRGNFLSVSLISPTKTTSFVKKLEDNNDLYKIINQLELYAMSDISFQTVTDPNVTKLFTENLKFEKSLLTLKREMNEQNRSAALYF